jgi:hypothetical protein
MGFHEEERAGSSSTSIALPHGDGRVSNGHAMTLIRGKAARWSRPDGFREFSPLNREPGGERPSNQRFDCESSYDLRQ